MSLDLGFPLPRYLWELTAEQAGRLLEVMAALDLKQLRDWQAIVELQIAEGCREYSVWNRYSDMEVRARFDLLVRQHYYDMAVSIKCFNQGTASKELVASVLAFHEHLLSEVAAEIARMKQGRFEHGEKG